MATFEPNHICKNKFCRKHYYACDYCSHIQSWRSATCSKECFEEYQKQVIEARSKNKTVSILPERLDMTEEEVVELLNAPTEIVLKKTKKDLAEFQDEDGNLDIMEAVELINEEINKNEVVASEENENKISSKRKNKQ